MILDASGSALAAAITAASLALAHARLPIFDILTSVTIVRIEPYLLLLFTQEITKLNVS